MAQTLTYIDRSNVSFASLQFKPDLGLTAEQYGLGAGAHLKTLSGGLIQQTSIIVPADRYIYGDATFT